MTPAFLVFLAGLGLAAPSPAPWPRGPVLDLTYPLDDKTPAWPTEAGFSLKKLHASLAPGGYYYAANSFSMPEHLGTHLDAPRHFRADGRSVDAVHLEGLLGPGVVLDVSEACRRNRDYQIRREDFLLWEKKNGRIPAGALVFLRTGFGRNWRERRLYLGTAALGEKALSQLHFPGLGADAARWLAESRRIGAVAIDTASIDHGPSRNFKTHQVLAEKNIPVIENAARLEDLPAKKFTAIALPLKIKGGTGSPIRLIAVLDK
ncbi:MAG: cyclase family protein [Elusimicrobia bacterium]|nr:cyclase family protein [Elusimicrobiota bacterium]